MNLDGFALPVKKLKGTDSVDTLDLSGKNLGVASAVVIASCISINGALTSVDLRGNKLRDKGWGAIFAAICHNKDSKISAMDASSENISPAGVKLIAEALRTSVTGGLTKVSLAKNELGEEGTKAICEALEQNKTLKELDISGEKFGKSNIGGTAGAKHVAKMVGINGGLTKLSLAHNMLGEEGTKAICEALEQNKTLKELDISGEKFGKSNIGGTAGAKHVAKMVGINGGLTSIDLSRNQLCGILRYVDVGQQGSYTSEGITAITNALRVNGGLTVTNLLGNQLDAESAKMLAEVAKQKDISLCGIQRDQTTANFLYKELEPPDAILLGSDLSQAVVTGALTSVKLGGKKLGDEGWGAIFAAICGNKDSKIMSMDACSENIGPAGVKLIAEALHTSVTGSLTVANLLRNELDAESAKMLVQVAKQKGISLCGILRDQTTADFSNQKLKPPDAILLASDLSQAVVTGSLTVTNLLGNQLDVKSAKMLAEVAKQKGISLCGIQRDQTTANFLYKGLEPPDAILLGSDLSQAIVTGALTDLYIWSNSIKDEGITAICNAVQGNKESKLAKLNVGDNNISPIGATAVAAMVAVTSGLMALNLSSNSLKDEGVNAVCEAIQSNKETKLTSLHFSYNGIGPVGANAVAAMVAMVAVTGGLTITSLAGNELGEEGTKALCEALEQNKTLKELDISGDWFGNKGSNIGGSAGAKHVAKMLDVNGALTKLSLAKNEFGEEGTKAICEALEQNKSLKELDISGDWSGNKGSNIGGSAGAKYVAKMLGVNGALTATNLLHNNLDAESAKLLAEVAKQKGISLCGILRDQTTADFSNQNLKLLDAILLATDLSHAIVTGGLMGLNFWHNNLKDDGVSAVCKAIQSNKETKLAWLNFNNNSIGPVGANAVAAMVAVTGTLTQVLAFGPPRGAFSVPLTFAFVLDGITAGPLKQSAVRHRSESFWNLQCRGHHSDCLCSARQWRIDVRRPRGQQARGRGLGRHLCRHLRQQGQQDHVLGRVRREHRPCWCPADRRGAPHERHRRADKYEVSLPKF